ncbi:MAG: hypothetical protein HY400_07110 [Elusimicrobia bacterium]|nr:hypothetical protein [Elusimicrobiota bacterium]
MKFKITRFIFLACLWHFLTLAAYYMVAPVRDAFLLHRFGAGGMPWVYMGTALATGVAVWIYNRFTHLSRKIFIGGTALFLASHFVVWWWIAQMGKMEGRTSFFFYIWTDVFAIMSVTLFWTYVDDVFAPRGARQYFGVFAATGSLGAMAGSWWTERWVHSLGLVPPILIAAFVYGANVIIFLVLEKWAEREGNSLSLRGRAVEDPARLKGILKMIFASRYLVYLTLLVCFERIVPDFSGYLFKAIASAAYPVREDLAAFAARYNFWQSFSAFVVGIFLTSYIVKRLGIGKSLLGDPLANLAGFAVLALVPVLPVVIFFNALEGVQRYTWFKSAKEITYTLADKEIVYKVKAFVEMFLYRFSRLLTGMLILLMTSKTFLGLGLKAVALLGIPLAIFWAWVAWRLGAEFDELESKGR